MSHPWLIISRIPRSLIRKNHLSHTLALFLSKNPSSPLRQSAPQTVYFNLSFADELDELLQDELYDVAVSFDENESKEPGQEKWWILKAALADKGNGIRLFSSREQLEGIFEEFEESSDEEEEEEDDEEDGNGRSLGYGEGTRVNASQLREWVVQVSGKSATPRSKRDRSHAVSWQPLIMSHCLTQQPGIHLFSTSARPPAGQLDRDQVPPAGVRPRRRRPDRLRPPPLPRPLCPHALPVPRRRRGLGVDPSRPHLALDQHVLANGAGAGSQRGCGQAAAGDGGA